MQVIVQIVSKFGMYLHGSSDDLLMLLVFHLAVRVEEIGLFSQFSYMIDCCGKAMGYCSCVLGPFG